MASFRLSLNARGLWLPTFAAPRAAEPRCGLPGRIDSIAGFSACASGISADLRTQRQLSATRGQDSDRVD